LLYSSKEFGLAANAQKTKCVFMSHRHQNVGQIQNTKVTNKYFENVAQFKNILYYVLKK